MKYVKAGLSTLLALCLLLSCVSVPVAVGRTGKIAVFEPNVAPDVPQNTDDRLVRAIILLDGVPEADVGERNSQRAAAQRIRLQNEQNRVLRAMFGTGCVLRERFTVLLSGFSCDIPQGALEAVAQIEGVSGVYIANSYEAPVLNTVKDSRQSYANILTGSSMAHKYGWDGRGTVIAVLDTGLNVSHEAFQDAPGYAQRYGILTEEAVQAAQTGGKGAYLSAKIPFAYDYADKDTDVSDQNGHGTHVSGIAVGLTAEKQADGSYETTFSGAAPAAQLLSMKIFKDSGGGTSTDIYFRALEDAYCLGADVINLSIGSPNGFTYDPRLEVEVFGNIYERLSKAGVLLSVATGNDYSMAHFASSYAGESGIIGPEYTDYGTVNSPASLAGTISVCTVENLAFPSYILETNSKQISYTENPYARQVSQLSSWGTTPMLTIDPDICSVGSMVYSAYTGAPDAYHVGYGTSMAAPNAAGAFASLLSLIYRQQPGLSRPAAAELAKDLMFSCAELLLDDAGSYYSPRKQGAGLANAYLAARALREAAYITNPLKELGDDPGKTGSYTFSVTLCNDSNASLYYTDFEAYVMYDRLGQTGSAFYNTLTSAYAYRKNREETLNADCLGAEARYLVNGTEVKELYLEAGQKLTVEVSIVLSEGAKEYFDAHYENGTFVEGYIVFNEYRNGEICSSTHAAFLTYYGDWTQGSVLEAVDFRDLLCAREPSELSFYTQPNAVYLTDAAGKDCGYAGENRMEKQPFYDVHIAFSTPRSDGSGHIAEGISIRPYLLRNARSLTMTVKDSKTGTVYYEETVEYLAKSHYDEELGWSCSPAFCWNGTGKNGGYLPSGTTVTVSFDAVLPYREARQKNIWSFDVTVDDTAPTIDKISYDKDTQTLTVTARDENYLQGIELTDTKGERLALTAFSSEKKGAVFTAKYSTRELEALGQTGCYITAMDYATNEKTVWYELPEEPPATISYPCYFDDFSDCTGQWYHEAVDFTVSKGYMNGVGDEKFDPDGSMTRAMIVTVLYREAGSPTAEEASTFTDVPPGKWYSDAIAWAQAHKIVNGISAAVFAPDDKVTREQIATILWRYSGSPEVGPVSLGHFEDAQEISGYAKNAICWAVKNGILNGDGKNLNPTDSATRAEFACMFMRYLKGFYLCTDGQ